jgi:hypothetical protein
MLHGVSGTSGASNRTVEWAYAWITPGARQAGSGDATRPGRWHGCAWHNGVSPPFARRRAREGKPWFSRRPSLAGEGGIRVPRRRCAGLDVHEGTIRQYSDSGRPAGADRDRRVRHVHQHLRRLAKWRSGSTGASRGAGIDRGVLDTGLERVGGQPPEAGAAVGQPAACAGCPGCRAAGVVAARTAAQQFHSSGADPPDARPDAAAGCAERICSIISRAAGLSPSPRR